MKPRLAVPDALAFLPLMRGLERRDATVELVRDSPSRVALMLAGARNGIKCAVVSPIDYARHGGSYRIVPGIAVSSSVPSGTAVLRIRPDARSVRTMATDLSANAEIVLASILLAEKFPPAGGEHRIVTIHPVEDIAAATFERNDAILEYRPYPFAGEPEGFVLDLYAEWSDMTDLPFVSGFWALREQDGSKALVSELRLAMERGVMVRKEAARDTALVKSLPIDAAVSRAAAFDYRLDEEHLASVEEYFRLAFFHGILGDVPDLKFYDPDEWEE